MRDITVVHIEDEESVHELLRDKLTGTEIKILAQTTTGEEGLRQIQSARPTVAIVDIRLGDQNNDRMNGHRVLREVRRLELPTHVLIHTNEGYYELVPDVLDQLLADGARGILFKHARSIELLQAIRTVAQGILYTPPSFSKRLGESELKRIDWDSISAMMKHCGAYLPLDLTNKEIAQALQERGMSSVQDTHVRDHLSNLYRILGTDRRTRAALIIHSLQHIGEWERPDPPSTH